MSAACRAGSDTQLGEVPVSDWLLTPLATQQGSHRLHKLFFGAAAEDVELC